MIRKGLWERGRERERERERDGGMRKGNGDKCEIIVGKV